jgi:hypothetical protein
MQDGNIVAWQNLLGSIETATGRRDSGSVTVGHPEAVAVWKCPPMFAPATPRGTMETDRGCKGLQKQHQE